ncbi:hypothetical protein PhaeoP75_01127 [Phaeobacter gallaeciensis]|uniref:hypothetical protein n=1 Tax=Phaeobacter gallaeciensis TaxID=60890 RepID=UPI000BBC199D|nr:hypothetical protein [Phaeobacter gallaeciensis]ATF00786.1 hypothetical protein PhaeoP75_01127 [Phaeobacter gallaeciensis]
MSKKLDYVTLADGWVADKWRVKGSIVTMTEAQAKYENVVRNTPEAIEGHAKVGAASKAMAEADRKAKADAEAKAKAKAEGVAKPEPDEQAQADAETNPKAKSHASGESAKGATAKK